MCLHHQLLHIRYNSGKICGKSGKKRIFMANVEKKKKERCHDFF